MAPKILFVLTSYGNLGGNDGNLGWFLPEFVHPYYKVSLHAEIVVASPEGGKAPLNIDSIAMSPDADSQRFFREKAQLWENTEVLEAFKGRAAEFDAIFYVGWVGPMFDLATSPVSHQIIREFWEHGKVVSAVYHGAVALAKVKLTDGSFLVAGQNVTGFSNREEEDTGLVDTLPFLLETELKKSLGDLSLYEKADVPWGPKVVVSGKDGRLIIGQNPASAGLIGDAIWKALSK